MLSLTFSAFPAGVTVTTSCAVVAVILGIILWMAKLQSCVTKKGHVAALLRLPTVNYKNSMFNQNGRVKRGLNQQIDTADMR